MPLDQVNNGDSGTSARGKINTAIAQVDTNTTAIATKQPLDAELTALAGLATDGLIAKTAAGTATTRTITGTSNKITVSNGDGVSGNPTLNIGTDVVTLTDSQVLTNKTLTSPLGIVKADVGLGNVDNTSDANKPVSTATQTALNLKQDIGGNSTLKYKLSLAETAGRSVANADLNSAIEFTIAGPETFNVILGAASFVNGGSLFIQNSETSAGTLTLGALGGANLRVGTKGTTLLPGDTCMIIRFSVAEWIRFF